MNSLAFLAVLLAGSSVAEAATAEARAKAWLQKHTMVDPVVADQQGMADLKASDPGAFQVVQALLMKQKLGLLNPKHPTASFAEGADAPTEHEGPTAVEF